MSFLDLYFNPSLTCLLIPLLTCLLIPLLACILIPPLVGTVTLIQSQCLYDHILVRPNSDRTKGN